MANTVFKLRRSSVAGKSPNTSTLSIGELAINLTDRKLYSSDGTNIFETGSNLTSLAVFSDIAIGNSTVNTTVNSTAFSGTANLASYVIANNGITSNASGVFVTQGTGVVVNATGVHVNSAYINTISSNLAYYVIANTGIVSNATGVFVNSAYINTISSNLAYYVIANTGLVSNATGVFVNSAYINTISSNNSAYLGGLAASNYANTSAPLITTSITVGNSTVNSTINSTSFSGTSSNATNLNSQPGSYYTNATNITTGILPYAQLGTNVVNTTSNFTITGIHTHSANIVVGNSTINATMFANSTNVYFTGISSFSNLASYVVANNGITSNASGVFVTQGTGVVVNATGVHVNATYINTISSNAAVFLTGNAITTNSTALIIANTAGVYANGSLGTSGQILTSNGSTVYWTTGVSQTSKIYSKTTASAGQNTFTTSSAFTSGAIDVYVNGVHLANSDYTEVNTTTVQLVFNCTSGQIVEISGYSPQSVVGNVNFTAAVNSFTGDGATTAFGLTTANVSTQSAFVFINGILQNPSNAYSISANVITFTSAPSNNDLVEVRIPQLVNANTSTTNVTAVVGNNTVQFTNTAYMVSNNQTVNAISQTVIDSYDATLYRTAKYLVQVIDNVANNYQCDEVMLTHDGATSYISVYGEIVTNTIIATFDTSYVSNNVRLLLTSTSANTTTKVLRTMLTV